MITHLKICCNELCANVERGKLLEAHYGTACSLEYTKNSVTLNGELFLYYTKNRDPASVYGITLADVTTCGKRVEDSDIYLAAISRVR